MWHQNDRIEMRCNELFCVYLDEVHDQRRGREQQWDDRRGDDRYMDDRRGDDRRSDGMRDRYGREIDNRTRDGTSDRRPDMRYSVHQ